MKITTLSGFYEYNGQLVTYFADSQFEKDGVQGYVIDMTLKNAQLWVSDPKKFNDPFDCRVPVYSLNPLPQNLIFDVVNSIVINGLGVRCFVKDPETSKNDQLMWAHYADKGNGVCLVFNPEKDQDYFNSSDIIGVEYMKQIQPLDIKNIDDLDEKDTDFLKLKCYSFGIKSEQWNYEYEVRAVKECCTFKTALEYFQESIEECREELEVTHALVANKLSEKISKHSFASNVRNFGFKKEALIEVRLGYNLCENRIEEIKNILNFNGYTHVKITQSKPNFIKGQVEYISI